MNYDIERERMVSLQIENRGVLDPRVLTALRKVPRHEFVPSSLIGQSYNDSPLPIGLAQTISQPYIVALMTELLLLSNQSKVLEIGTGCGYQTAVLAEIASMVYTIEIREELQKNATYKLTDLGYKNISFHLGDGFFGLEQFAPFDAIIVTAAPEYIPPSLKKQLKLDGRMVIPVGNISEQSLKVVHKEIGSYTEHNIISVRFVPMVEYV